MRNVLPPSSGRNTDPLTWQLSWHHADLRICLQKMSDAFRSAFELRATPRGADLSQVRRTRIEPLCIRARVRRRDQELERWRGWRRVLWWQLRLQLNDQRDCNICSAKWRLPG